MADAEAKEQAPTIYDLIDQIRENLDLLQEGLQSLDDLKDSSEDTKIIKYQTYAEGLSVYDNMKDLLSYFRKTHRITETAVKRWIMANSPEEDEEVDMSIVTKPVPQKNIKLPAQPSVEEQVKIVNSS